MFIQLYILLLSYTQVDLKGSNVNQVRTGVLSIIFTYGLSQTLCNDCATLSWDYTNCPDWRDDCPSNNLHSFQHACQINSLIHARALRCAIATCIVAARPGRPVSSRPRKKCMHPTRRSWSLQVQDGSVRCMCACEHRERIPTYTKESQHAHSSVMIITLLRRRSCV